MKHCSTCGIPETAHIPLDEQNQCRVCRHWDDYRLKISGDFATIAERIRDQGHGKSFDCVVGISGGRDSSYTLYKLVRDFNLRCVAVFIENTFTPPETIQNVIRITEQLGVKLFRQRIDPAYHIKIAKAMIAYWQKSHNPLFSNLACAPCKLFNKRVFRIANRLGVRSIVYGGNPYEFFYVGPGDTSKSRGGRFTFGAMLYDAFSKIGRGASLLVSNIGLLRHLPLIVQASILYCNQYSPWLKLRYPNITPYDLFHHYEWDESEMNAILTELGWVLPAGCISTWRADCEFEEVKNYMFRKSVGISHIHSLYANLARANKITRDESIARSEAEAFSDTRLKLALKTLSLKTLEKDPPIA